ncbi:hypothetical protein PIB30_069309 [Stylosanthes scabra]|uniref:Uncharacterized protein n=1 Tax=Stylosanthes scabra TaxID=79078 RepID=A0ABU6VQL4_9FABA|nr:hypothetical protein [Stylosanthes scabra]
MAVRTYHEDIPLNISKDIIISLSQKGYVSDFEAFCQACSTWTISPSASSRTTSSLFGKKVTSRLFLCIIKNTNNGVKDNTFERKKLVIVGIFYK